MNIIELAKESGASVIEDDPQCWIGCIGFDAIALERFADQVLEAAAVECDKREHAGDAGALMAARAIRALKGPK